MSAKDKFQAPGGYGASTREYNMNSSNDPFDYREFKQDWDDLIERQRYKDAEKLCHEGLAKSPLDQSRGKLYNHLGFLYENYLEDKTFDDILEHYVLSLQVDESNAASHYNLANFLLEQGMQHLLRSLELNPNFKKAKKRYAGLSPIEVNTTLDLAGAKYQVIDIVEDGVRAVRLTSRRDGGYEPADTEPVTIGISEATANSSAGKGTANVGSNASPGNSNGDEASSRRPLEVEDYNDDDVYATQQKGCCYKCVLRWWFWACLWLVALGGVAVPVLGYLMFAEEECRQVTTTESVALNVDEASQGELNILFVMNCAAESWQKQFDSANSLLENVIDGGVSVNYDIMQYCAVGGDSQIIGNLSDITTDFVAYTASSSVDATQYDQETDYDSTAYLTAALEACQLTYSTYDDTDTTPFLCIPVVSQLFADPFQAMTISTDTDFAEIYLAFMVDSSETGFDDNLYSVLGAFATGTECIARSEDDYAFGNTWWSNRFTCDAATGAALSCPHCINYEDSAEIVCASTQLRQIFEGEGVTENQVMQSSEEECTYTYKYYYFYSIGGVVPLLVWVLVTMLVLCCNSCRSSRSRRNMEAHNGLHNNDQKQTAFV
eukprot:CAMPEP_0197042628 /NCGR_PEP_ID=MMETSP1384-20130603/18961_1 /TAXON_ID=29189 /ORGANISM="Ammonia sp." /LENGTH=605 /DNA_ID=CAMNT_0042473775 /DNA_START=125 /DNA_END=1942 /DNA_ORIENTATION=-